MRTVQEIQKAVESLPEMQRFELINWLHLKYEGILTEEEEQALLAEAEIGAREIAEGKGIPLEEARKMTGTWITKSPPPK